MCIRDRLNTFLKSEVNDGLVLISDFSSETIVLIDIDNNIVNFWEVNDYDLLRSYLTPDSILVTISKLNNLPVLQKYDWDGLLLWTFIFEEGECLIHHEQVILPNGKILAICKETINAEERAVFNNGSINQMKKVTETQHNKAIIEIKETINPKILA